ncbi:HAD-IA family hydrolase [Shewanella sp. SNU WT4]|uniref:HAD family hydrolase n=1 Tax=Shewanella sp. SNU WT4 TaxID=2590015 RepID=UPI0011286A03|nr:HAD-IA family hydrolase [Shewanella sp. SNU WT4]QDF68532.1 HAD-IA family hydrolase [Shewanella sp. SNU WT4]
MNCPQIKAVLFDLDGTIVDTAPDLVAALNLALNDAGLAPAPYQQVKSAASHGSMALVNAAAPHLQQGEKLAIQHDLLQHYQRINGQYSEFFEGMEHLIHTLTTLGIPQGIVTNKHARFSRPLCQHLNLTVTMQAIVSGDSCLQPKPHPAPMLLAASQLGCRPEHILYLGDAARDMEAAVNAGMIPALALWGYLGDEDHHSWPSRLQFNHPQELEHFLQLNLSQ